MAQSTVIDLHENRVRHHAPFPLRERGHGEPSVASRADGKRTSSSPVPSTPAHAHSTLPAAVLSALLDVVDGVALVICCDGHVVAANEAGVDLARQLGGTGLLRLAHDVLVGVDTRYRVVPLETSERPHYLMAPAPRATIGVHRLRVKARAWSLTKRQAQTLECLVGGMCNKEIAAVLSCALRTVEVHVSAVLRASGASSRTEAVALFWADSLP